MKRGALLPLHGELGNHTSNYRVLSTGVNVNAAFYQEAAMYSQSLSIAPPTSQVTSPSPSKSAMT